MLMDVSIRPSSARHPGSTVALTTGPIAPAIFAPTFAPTLFGLALAFGLLFSAYSLIADINATGGDMLAWLPYLLLFLALLIALGFEFVNGFHDTANAVATVIYTNSLPPSVAVVWSGLFNFLGVLLSSGAVAFGIISLLPVELMLQVGSGAGLAMVFALLIAAMIWNLGTWWLGLPASSSHTLIGSILGVGIAHALMLGRPGVSGIDWAQAAKVGYSLILSPLLGFACAALLYLLMKRLVKNRALYHAPVGLAPPPWWIRGMLLLTCSGVSFAHGSNDGQKGMGLIMLILVGTVPITYALNRAIPAEQIAHFVTTAQLASQSLNGHVSRELPKNPRMVVTELVQSKAYSAAAIPALADLIDSIASQVRQHGSLAGVPHEAVANVRNDMYLAAEAIRVIDKSDAANLDTDARTNLRAFKAELDSATKFIPLWVKISVAIALGLGTMVGWKRIVVTVGEKIGKQHLTYAQGASAEMVAMATIGAADAFGLPVSTTHVLSSGVAGTMAASHAGLQWQTIRHLAMAWLLTLPAAILLSGSLYWLFAQLV